MQNVEDACTCVIYALMCENLSGKRTNFCKEANTMLTKTEMSLKNIRKNRSQANPQQSKPAQRRSERLQNVMFRRVAL